jgi:hypothetical protein
LQVFGPPLPSVDVGNIIGRLSLVLHSGDLILVIEQAVEGGTVTPFAGVPIHDNAFDFGKAPATAGMAARSIT